MDLASRSKRCLRTGSEENCAGRILIVTLRSSRVSRARYLAHPACTERGGDLIGTEMHPGSESHKWA
jgi:hypothetical protein